MPIMRLIKSVVGASRTAVRLHRGGRPLVRQGEGKTAQDQTRNRFSDIEAGGSPMKQPDVILLRGGELFSATLSRFREERGWVYFLIPCGTSSLNPGRRCTACRNRCAATEVVYNAHTIAAAPSMR